MEGNQYQIHTMARDLEEAERALSKVSLEVRAQAAPPAPTRMERGEQLRGEPKDGQALREERKLEEILHEARRRIETPPIRSVPSPRARPLEGPDKKMLEDILPIEEKAARPLPAEVLPPPNLPMAEVTLPVPSRAGQTPEEILGLPLPVRPVHGKPPKALPAPAPRGVAGPAAAGPKRFRALPTLKFALFTTFLSIALIATAFGAFKLFFGHKPPSPPAPPLAKIIEQPLPQALLRYDEVKVIELNELSYDALKPAIDALQDVNFAAGSFLYIPIKYSSETEIRYLTAAEFFEILHIDLPPFLAASEFFTPFLYIQADAARVGFVLALQEGGAVGVMKEWEKTIVEDLLPLLPGTAKREEGAVFRLGSYKDFETHFINLPIPTTSVDWVLADGNLVVATSKDSARAALDRLPNP